MSLVPFLSALKDKCKCWKPIWNAILRKFWGYFSRSKARLGWGKGKEKKIFFFKVAFDSPKCTATQEGSQFPLWRKKRKQQQKNGVISRPNTIHLPKPKTSRHWKAGEESFCFFLVILHLAKSSVVRVCVLSFPGGRVQKKPSLFFHWDPAAAVI